MRFGRGAAEAATQRAPEDGAAWLLLGQLYAHLAHDEKASDALGRAARYDAGSFEAHVGLAAAAVETPNGANAIGSPPTRASAAPPSPLVP